MDNLLYKKVIEITRDYLGPASTRVIDRQIQNHLHKEPNELKEGDLPRLVEWAEIAFSLLTEDSSVADEYAERLMSLAGSSKKRQVHKNAH